MNTNFNDYSAISRRIGAALSAHGQDAPSRRLARIDDADCRNFFDAAFQEAQVITRCLMFSHVYKILMTTYLLDERSRLRATTCRPTIAYQQGFSQHMMPTAAAATFALISDSMQKRTIEEEDD